jgi:hypothetical protein
MEQEVINGFVLSSINELKLVNRKKKDFSKLLAKHNPYELTVFCSTPNEIVNFVMSSHKQTSRQTIMGYLLESIAVKVISLVFNGYKSKEECTDLEWVVNGLIHYRGWKSSPNWGNADQKNRVNHSLKVLCDNDNFGSFKVLTSYGKTSKKMSEKSFNQISGQDSWFEISNDPEMYNKVMVGILEHSKLLSEVIEKIYVSDINESIEWVINNFTNEDKTLNFIKINEYVSRSCKNTNK